MPENELLPCPFCGEEVKSENTITEGVVHCSNCNAGIIRRNKKNDDSGLKEAIKAWNTRPPKQKPQGVSGQPEPNYEQIENEIDQYLVQRVLAIGNNQVTFKGYPAEIIQGLAARLQFHFAQPSEGTQKVLSVEEIFKVLRDHEIKNGGPNPDSWLREQAEALEKAQKGKE